MAPRYSWLASWIFLASIASAQTTELVSIATNGTQGDLGSIGGLVSADGRFVLFASQAHTFWPNDPDIATGPDFDVFLRDRLLGTTTDLSEAFPNALPESMSADGEWVTFSWSGTTTWGHPVARSMLWERATGNLQPLVTGDLECYFAALSADGRYAAFIGRYLPNGVVNAVTQAYLLDRRTGSIVCASRTPTGLLGNGTAYTVAISADGSRVAFDSNASNLVPNDTNDSTDVFVYDARSGNVRRASVNAQGVEADFGAIRHTISADGRFVAFLSVATNLVPGPVPPGQMLYRKELSTGAVEMLTVTSAGTPVPAIQDDVKLSGDGRLAFFASEGTTLVPNDGNHAHDVFVRDTLNHTTERISTALGGGEANSNSFAMSVSSDGRFVAITSDASNLVANDVNGQRDVFVIDRGPQCWISSFCTAVPNSTGNAASISAQGVPSFTTNDLVLACDGLPPATVGFFFAGTHPYDPGVVFGNGLRCVGGDVIRLGIVHANGSVATQAQDLASAVYAGVQPGDTRYFQFEYRNQAAGGAGFNTSDALLVTFCP